MADLFALILMFLAPIAFIILPAFNIGRKNTLSILLTTAFMVFLGFIFTIAAAKMFAGGQTEALSPGEMRCSAGDAAIAFIGILLSLTVIPFTGIISLVCFLLRRKKTSPQGNPV